MIKTLNVQAIRIDGGTQSRTELSQQTVAEYRDFISGGGELPAIIVFGDGSDYWLADGFHRYHAHRAALKTSIKADVRVGSQRDALLHALGANATHGLPRSNADKRRAVGIMLNDEEWSAHSDRMIADICCVSNAFVSGMRREADAAARQKDLLSSGGGGDATVNGSQLPATRTVRTANGKEMVVSVKAPAPIPAPVTKAPVAAPAPEVDHAEDANCDFDPLKMLEQTQVENERLQATVAACGADDKSAEIIKWRQIAEQAQRREQEHQAVITAREKELQKQARLWARIGKAVGEEDPTKIAAAVERLALAAKQAEAV